MVRFTLLANTSQPLWLVLLLAVALPSTASTVTSVQGNDLMVETAFVDIYHSYCPLVVATSDGGAVYSVTRDSRKIPRVIKVDSSGTFEWFIELRVTGDSDTSPSTYYPKAILENAIGSTAYIYLAGDYGCSSSYKAFVIKYKEQDGTHVISKFLKGDQSATYSSIFSLILNSAGVLVFGGYYSVGSDYAWLGTIDSSNLADTQHTFTPSTNVRIYNIIQDTSSGNYVLTGSSGADPIQLWAGVMDCIDWTILATKACSASLSNTQQIVTVQLETGRYGLLWCGYYYNFIYTAPSTIAYNQPILFDGSQTIAPTLSSDMFMILGNSSGSSFAYYFSPSTLTKYDKGEIAAASNVGFYSSSKSPKGDYVWTAGYTRGTINLGFVAKVAKVTAVSCSAGEYNYFNQGCYTPATTDCFALCDTCLFPSNINACSTSYSASADGSAVSLFAGRCKETDKFYRVATALCEFVVQTGCHILCGGECTVANDASNCAHHCIGASFEPHIDSSDLAINVCKCASGYAFSALNNSCQPCHPLCSECVLPENSTSCSSCNSSITNVAFVSPSTCKCDSGMVYSTSSGACESCHPFCNECYLPGDSTACVACASISGMVPTTIANRVSCSCASGTVYSTSTGKCESCHPLCLSCAAPGDPTACKTCISSPSVQMSDKTCSCIIGTFYSSSNSECEKCHPLCSGSCYASNDPTQCSDCVSDGTVDKVANSDGSYSCTCLAGTAYSVASGACEACYALCLTCTAPGDGTACTACVTSSTIARSGTAAPYTCSCAEGTMLVGNECKACNPLCDGCSAPDDGTKCLACSSKPNVVTVTSTAPYTCACVYPTQIYSGFCSYSSGCDPLCAGWCTRKNDSSACVRTCIPTASRTTQLDGMLKCKCPAGRFFNGTLCANVLTTGCYAICGAGCAEADNQTRCVDCSEGKNVVATLVDSYFYKCECAVGTEIVNSTCGYLSGCSPYCVGCVTQNSSSSCISCASGTTLGASTETGAVSCSCPADAKFYCAGQCRSTVSDYSTCHPLCQDGCLSPNDNTRCVTCKTQTDGLVKSTSTAGCEADTCGCTEGAKLTSKGVCVPDYGCDPLCDQCIDDGKCASCPQGLEGMELSDGKCICSTGYVSKSDGTCYKSITAIASATKYAGSAVVAGLILSSALASGGGSMLWKFLNLEQELMLLAVVNAQYVSDTLITIFAGLSFINFNVFSPVVGLLPDEILGLVGYNALYDNAQYHPTLSGKLFLANVGNYICFAILSLLGYVACLLLGCRFGYFRRLKESYVFNGVICTLQSSFVDVLLCAFTQIRYFTFGYTAYYTISCFAACAAVIIEATFLAFTFYILRRPTDVLLSDNYKSRYGALYADLTETQPGLSTSLLHNVRLFAVVPLVVLLADYPLGQSTIYTAFALAGMVWDARFVPYEGILAKIEYLSLGVAKIAAGIGYILLSVDSATESFSEVVCLYEVVVFVVAIGGGLIITVLEVVVGLCSSVKEWHEGRSSSCDKVTPTAMEDITREAYQKSMMT